MFEFMGMGRWKDETGKTLQEQPGGGEDGMSEEKGHDVEVRLKDGVGRVPAGHKGKGEFRGKLKQVDETVADMDKRGDDEWEWGGEAVEGKKTRGIPPVPTWMHKHPHWKEFGGTVKFKPVAETSDEQMLGNHMFYTLKPAVKKSYETVSGGCVLCVCAPHLHVPTTTWVNKKITCARVLPSPHPPCSTFGGTIGIAISLP